MPAETKPPATVSVDVDPLDIHLAGYGAAAAPDDLVYKYAVPRLLKLLGETGTRATFFFVARDSARPPFAAAVRAVEAAGHEAASHSLNHGIPFRKLALPAFTNEIRESKQRIEAITGRAVAGFRAPNWDISNRELDILTNEGYQYDASAYPSLLLCAARLLVATGGGGISTFTKLKFLPFTTRRDPYLHKNGRIVEFPITVAGLLRFPIYHTLCYKKTREQYHLQFSKIARAGRPFFYTLHAIDALSIEDGADPRLRRHPGMERALPDKLKSLENCFLTIGELFESRPYRELLYLAKS